MAMLASAVPWARVGRTAPRLRAAAACSSARPAHTLASSSNGAAAVGVVRPLVIGAIVSLRSVVSQSRPGAASRPRRCAATAAAADEAPDVAASLARVKAQVDAACAQRPAAAAAAAAPPVRLVAVSKTKPVEALAAAYAAGHRHFGENYVQELVNKAPELPPDVQWHFIGHLQSNKAKVLVKGCPSLSCVETVESEKLARMLNKAAQSERQTTLRVMVQVNSSGEGTKGGVQPSACVELCKFIASECESLDLVGLMTIGAPDYSGCRTEDFETLHRCRNEVAAAIGREPASLELSMGMSNDFERAIVEGSTSVRVGSSIFGARSYPANNG